MRSSGINIGVGAGGTAQDEGIPGVDLCKPFGIIVGYEGEGSKRSPTSTESPTSHVIGNPNRLTREGEGTQEIG